MSNKKNAIVDSALKLFYDNGYNATSFEQIAEDCNITKPLITYYFKTKYNLARAVNNKFLIELKNAVAIKTYELAEIKNVQLSTAVDMRVVEMLYRVDPKANRFILQVPTESFGMDSRQSFDASRYKIHERQHQLETNKQAGEIELIAVTSQSALRALHNAFFNNYFTCTYEELVDYMISMTFRVMKTDQNRIDEIVSRSKEIFESLTFEISPYFKVK